MPKNRIGFSSDFVLNNSKVGIATTNPTATLHVAGVLKGDFNITGVTTLTQYAGFAPQKQNVSLASTIGFTTTGIGTVGITSFVQINERETGFISLVGEFNTLSEDIVVDEGRIFEVSTTQNIGITTLGTQSVYIPSDSVVSAGTLESISVQSHFSVPNAGISSRPAHPVEGMVRFNDDLNTLEFWNGFEWRQFTVTGASGRALTGGGFNGSSGVSGIEFFNISSQGNAQNFGNLTLARFQHGSCSSSTRGLWCGGAPATNVIDYVTIASLGNAIQFGESTLTLAQRHGGLSSSTRGIFNSGLQSSPATVTINVIEYVEISTIGNALDFGDLSKARFDLGTSASSTRGIFAGGFNENDVASISVIDFITISSKGDAKNFGDISVRRRGIGGASNSVRGIFAGGATPSVTVDTIEYITIASSGNGIDFGKLSTMKAACKLASSNTRAVIVGSNDNTNTIEYVVISTLGNSQDFGDLSVAGQQRTTLSDSHGGLGGF